MRSPLRGPVASIGGSPSEQALSLRHACDFLRPVEFWMVRLLLMVAGLTSCSLPFSPWRPQPPGCYQSAPVIDAVAAVGSGALAGLAASTPVDVDSPNAFASSDARATAVGALIGTAVVFAGSSAYGWWSRPRCQELAQQAEDARSLAQRSLPPPVIRISPNQVAARCVATPVHGPDGQRRFFQYYVDCPMPVGYLVEDVRAGAVHSAALRGALLESDEFMLGWISEPPVGWIRAVVFFSPEPAFFETRREGAPTGFTFLRPETVLPREIMASVREHLEIGREDVAYDACKKLLLNPEEAARSPEKAHACTNTVAVVERAREARRVRREREEDLAMRRAAMADERAQREADRQAIEMQTLRLEEMERQRRRAEAIRAIGDSFKTTTTHCQPDGLGGVRCTTR